MHRLAFSRFGPPAEVLELQSLELPPLAEGEVRLRILAAPVNPADLNFIEGTYGIKPELPAVSGIEGCGEVTESGDPRFAPGDLAVFLKRSATWASHVQVPGDILFKLPAGIDPRQAAMLKVNPATAWQLLTGFRRPEPGSWIVQNAANSGVGRCVIRLAKSIGVRTMNFVRRAELVDELKALGADHVAVDGEEGFQEAKQVIGKPGAALGFNAVGGESALRVMNLLAPHAVHITFGAMARRPLTIPNGLLIFKDLQFRGLWITKWIEQASEAEIAETYGRLAEMVVSGELVQPVDAEFPLAEFQAALVRAGEGSRSGKVLFVP
ncbi:2-enoyl thioester reductase domain-containing protein [Luteolibacter sp. LG18]|uniref:MDR family NADPH-dependent oxidoreductase n=1 Tax=Luteolibacter sp. LG18 TaxID=2819286 RepID=UPI002B2F238A|nr:alcohol dehydrogenase [Luteolibacter sp. LG18]